MIGVVGFGNVLMGDDGAGCECVRRITERYIFEPSIDIVDAGVGSLTVPLHLYDKLILVDAVQGTGSPGDVILFDRSHLVNRKIKVKLSLHAFSFDELLTLLEIRGEAPEEIYLVGIVIEKANFGMGLSEYLFPALEEAERVILSLLEGWGIRWRKISD